MNRILKRLALTKKEQLINKINKLDNQIRTQKQFLANAKIPSFKNTLNKVINSLNSKKDNLIKELNNLSNDYEIKPIIKFDTLEQLNNSVINIGDKCDINYQIFMDNNSNTNIAVYINGNFISNQRENNKFNTHNLLIEEYLAYNNEELHKNDIIKKEPIYWQKLSHENYLNHPIVQSSLKLVFNNNIVIVFSTNISQNEIIDIVHKYISNICKIFIQENNY